jgi:two-component system cell cycle response regulator DivK
MSGETILIVEDSPVSLRLTASLLRTQGYSVHVASTGEQALTSLRYIKPDLILVDLMLPGMDGLELTSRIKQDSRLLGVKVLALTACGMEGDEERARHAGCDGYLTKPIEKQTLLEQVRRHLGFGGEAIAPPAPAHKIPPAMRREASPQPISLGIPESEMEDLKRTFLADGVVQSRQLLAALEQGFDQKQTALLSHRWAGTGGLLGFPKISDRARQVDHILRTPPWTAAGLRAALTNLVREFADPAAAVAELRIPDSIVQQLQGKRVALVGLADLEAERLASALARVGAKPRLFEADNPPHAQAICECHVALIHVRPETMETPWLTPEFVPPALPMVFIGTRERLFALNAGVQARAREFLIDGWQPEEALMRLSFALSRTAGTEPAAAASQAAAPVTPQRRTAPGTAEILIADDDAAVRTLVCSALENFGMHCRLAASGPEALEAVRVYRPHAAVLDVNMPGMDGFEVLAAIRAENIPVRVILLTARQQDDDVLRGFSLGADDYVMKPFNPMELVARLQRLLVG